jgi:hypothetical protein
MVAVDRALTAATPRSGRPSAFIARPSAAFGKSFTPHNVMEVDASRPCDRSVGIGWAKCASGADPMPSSPPRSHRVCERDTLTL